MPAAVRVIRHGFTTMKRLLLAGLLALPGLMLTGTAVRAQCHGGACGTLGPGAAPVNAFWGCKHVGGCGAFCFTFLGSIHQHGPLFNYGPYQGYYPFQPYGDWTPDLKYVGPTWHAIPKHKLFDGLGGHCGRCGGLLDKLHGGCGKCGHGGEDGGCGWETYSKHTFKNVFHRLHPCAHKCGSKSCLDDCCNTATCADGTCDTVPAAPAPQADPSAPMLPEKPVATAGATGAIQQTGYPRRER